MDVVLYEFDNVREIDDIRLFEFNIIELTRNFNDRGYNFFVDSHEKKVFLHYDALIPQLKEVFGDIIKSAYIVLDFNEVRFFDCEQYNIINNREYINDTSTIFSNYRILVDFNGGNKVIFSSDGFYARKLNLGDGFY